MVGTHDTESLWTWWEGLADWEREHQLKQPQLAHLRGPEQTRYTPQTNWPRVSRTRTHQSPSGGTARVEAFGNGNLDISLQNAPGVTIGSLEGSGNIFLGTQNLAVGSNNLSTTFSGIIQDGGQNGTVGGSFTKIGAGTLTLAGDDTYTGGTIVNSGTLLISNSTGSATGSGPVIVNNSGTLGGTGTIGGAVTVNGGGTVNPGAGVGTLALSSNLTFTGASGHLATYQVDLNGATNDKLVVSTNLDPRPMLVLYSGPLAVDVRVGNPDGEWMSSVSRASADR